MWVCGGIANKGVYPGKKEIMSLETSGLSIPKPKEQKRLPKAGEALSSSVFALLVLVLILILVLALILALVLVAVLFVSHGALPPV